MIINGNCHIGYMIDPDKYKARFVVSHPCLRALAAFCFNKSGAIPHFWLVNVTSTFSGVHTKVNI